MDTKLLLCTRRESGSPLPQLHFAHRLVYYTYSQSLSFLRNHRCREIITKSQILLMPTAHKKPESQITSKKKIRKLPEKKKGEEPTQQGRPKLNFFFYIGHLFLDTAHIAHMMNPHPFPVYPMAPLSIKWMYCAGGSS